MKPSVARKAGGRPAGDAAVLPPATHTSTRSLADFVAFNTSPCPGEMNFGEELFEISDGTNTVRLKPHASMG